MKASIEGPSAVVTEIEINKWKAKHPRGVWEISVDTDEQNGEKEIVDSRGRKRTVPAFVQKVGYLRKPTRTEMSAAMSGASRDPLGTAEGLLRDCWLGGDEVLLDDDDYFQATLMQFQELMEVRNGEIKKL